MLIIGEKINSIIPSVQRMVKERDGKALRVLALNQLQEGARILDVNVDDTERADPETSKENLKWAIKTVQEAVPVPLMIDSADTQVLAVGFRAYDFSRTCPDGQGTPFLNSLNEENKEEILDLVSDYQCNIVMMADLRAAKTSEEKIETARELRDFLQQRGVDPARIYVDPGVSSIGVDPFGALRTIEAVKGIKRELGLKTICAPSNVSYQACEARGRKILNAAFVRLLELAGIDAVIANPRDILADPPEELFEAAKEALEGKDRRLKNFRRRLEV